MTRRGLENARVRVFTEMVRSGASKEEAFAYIDLIYPLDDEALDLTLAQLNHRMLAAADAVDEAAREYRKSNSEWVEAERDYRHARAIKRARLKATKVGDREDELFLMTEDEWVSAEQAKVLKDSAKEALRATMAILNGLQSVALGSP